MSDALLLNSICILLFGASLWVAARLIRSPGRSSGVLSGLMVICAWSLVISSFTAIAMIAMTLIGGLGIWVATFVVVAMIFNRIRLARQDTLLAVLATTTEKGMPLVRVFDALSGEFRGLYGGRMRRFVALLECGVPLAEALHRVPRLVPRQAAVAARIGADAGQMAAALNGVVEARARRAPLWNPVVARGAWLVWTLLGLLVLGGFYQSQLAPRMSMTLQDFGVEPSTATASNMFLPTSTWLAMPIIGPAAAVAAVVFPYLLLVYIGWLPLILPLGPLRRPFETGPLLRNLALLAEAGRPLPPGLVCLSEISQGFWLRRRLRLAARMLAAGHPLSAALEKSKLINRTNAGLVAAAERMGNLPWALRTIADSADRRLTYRLQALAQIGVPLVLALLGILVALIALEVFGLLAEIIQALAPTRGW